MYTTSFNSFKSQACWHARVTAILTDTTYHENIEKLLHSPLLQIGPEVRRRNSQHAICKSLFGSYIASFSGSYTLVASVLQVIERWEGTWKQWQFQSCQVTRAGNTCGGATMSQLNFCTKQLARILPRLAQVWNRQCLEMRLSCYKYVTSRDSFETLTGN